MAYETLRQPKKRIRGFSIAEVAVNLLVLALFLGLFAALLFPAVRIGLDSPPKSQAKNDVTQIVMAAATFQVEYGRAVGTNRGTVSGEMLAALIGGNVQINPRKLVFLEVPAYKKNRGGDLNGVYCDPWGQPYQIAFAEGTNNWVLAGTNNVRVPKTVAVWTDPVLQPRGWFSDEKKIQKRYVTSWD